MKDMHERVENSVCFLVKDQMLNCRVLYLVKEKVWNRVGDRVKGQVGDQVCTPVRYQTLTELFRVITRGAS